MLWNIVLQYIGLHTYLDTYSTVRAYTKRFTAVFLVYIWVSDDCRVSQLVLLDLSVAFDTVDHQILLCVLSDHFSISSTAFNWFQSYLSERTHLFVHAGLVTDCFPVTCSVPQGSVFRPLGFIAYTEDLTVVSEKHSVHLLTYAADIQGGPKNRTAIWQFVTPVYVDIEQRSIYQTVQFFYPE